MQRTTHNILTAIIGTFVCVVAAHGVWAQGLPADRSAHAGDPARWHQEDITPRARYETLKKEAGAAHRVAQFQCKKTENFARLVCMQEARNVLGRDLAAARLQVHSTRS